MSFSSSLPKSAHDVLDWTWEQFSPFYAELESRTLDESTVTAFLQDWTAVSRLVSEMNARINVATTVNTADELAEKRFLNLVENIVPNVQAADNKLERKLVFSELEPAGMQIPLRNMRTSVEIFREANLPLFSDESKVSLEYDRVAGAQTVTWEGEEKTVSALNPILEEPDRDRRKEAWRTQMARRIQDREAINALWKQFMDIRKQQAANADFSDYRAFRWKLIGRFDYTPEDSKAFQDAIEAVVVPAAARIYARKQAKLGLDSLRPWDVDATEPGAAPLKPYETTDELISKTQAIFDHVDPALGAFFATMTREGLLDLDNRKNKAPGGYCTDFALSERPFIFMNAVGIHDDVQTLLHEGGHAFHAFESVKQPYFPQIFAPIEFCEVASMGMELLSGRYLSEEFGGFYSAQDAARARIQHIEGIIQFWPYMAVVDAFQHWVYSNHEAATAPVNCDAQWSALWDRFMVGQDWTGLEEIKATGWQRKLHIHQIPFYYIEYGLAQLGAVQLYANSLKDQAGTVAAYRRALALGNTVTLPELFEAAGVRFAFDTATIKSAVDLLEQTLETLESQAQ